MTSTSTSTSTTATTTTNTTSSSSILIKTVTTSAPGKILLAGGYLVLEAPNVGLVVAVDKRFYTTAKLYQEEAGHEEEENDNNLHALWITVTSPQFRQEWRYSYNKTTGALSSISADGNSNSFLEKTLRVSLLYALNNNNCESSTSRSRSRCGRRFHLRLTIRADNDFYSLVPHLKARHMDRSLASVLALPAFLPAVTHGHKGGGAVSKTGLGSSACLVTSLVAAICCMFPTDEENVDTTTTTTTMTINSTLLSQIANLAQLCHCYAQGKIGSGFDVSAACFGSHVYTRFDKSIIENVLSRLDHEKIKNDDDSSSVNDIQLQLRQLVNDNAAWSTTTVGVTTRQRLRPLSLPCMLQVMLADVNGGSESPSMARKVLEWRRRSEQIKNQQQPQQQQQQDHVDYWNQLAETNQTIVTLLEQIGTACSSATSTTTTPTLSDKVVQRFASTRAQEWNTLIFDDKDEPGGGGTVVAKLLYQLHSSFLKSRTLLKQMGAAVGNGVDIEPDAQTRLANATLQLPGVVAALVPGAGGHDAMACVYIDHTSPGNDQNQGGGGGGGGGSVRHAIARLWAEWTDTENGDDHDPVKVCPLAAQGVSYGDGLRIEKEEPIVPSSL